MQRALVAHLFVRGEEVSLWAYYAGSTGGSASSHLFNEVRLFSFTSSLHFVALIDTKYKGARLL